MDVSNLDNIQLHEDLAEAQREYDEFETWASARFEFLVEFRDAMQRDIEKINRVRMDLRQQLIDRMQQNQAK